MPLLMWLFVIPLIASMLLLVLGLRAYVQRIALVLSLLPLALLFYGHGQWLGSEVLYEWIPSLGIQFHLRVDVLSLFFLYLTAVIVPVSIMATPQEDVTHPHVFYGLILLVQGFLIGFFTARDLVLFALFWEAMLLPLYVMIGGWGSGPRQRVALKFIIYMVAGSALMVAAILALYMASLAEGSGTFDLDALAGHASNIPYAAWLAAIFFLAFAVKTPLFPFHAWLPDTYYHAPLSGTILLSALLSKAGIYGFLRIGEELFSPFIQAWSPLFLGLAVVGVFYGGLAAWVQSDFKRLLAYSSFAHVNFILVGVFVWNHTAQSGAVLQAINHGVTIAALFLVAGWLERRLGTTTIAAFSGVARDVPKLCWLTLFFVVSSVALPGTNSFVGELMILLGLFFAHPWLAAFLSLTIVLTVVYMLRWMQSVYFETPRPFYVQSTDIGTKELAIALPLVILVLWIGIYPAPLLRLLGPTVAVVGLENAS